MLSENKKTKFRWLFLALIFPICTPIIGSTENTDEIILGNFSQWKNQQGLSDGWEPLNFKNIEVHTSYRLVYDAGVQVIEADSRASSSGITRRIAIDPTRYPILSWKWKIANIYTKGDVTRKQGDDYPARIYITFAYDSNKVGLWDKVKYNTIKLIYGEYPPLNAINYIWASKATKGMITPNPYTDKVKMIVIESGTEKLNQWVTEQRNILKDYRKAFHEEPPLISGIAIMTDSDNTGENAKAWYGDITLSKK